MKKVVNNSTSVKRKTQLILPRDLLEDVKKVAGSRKRSQFIAEATQEKLARLRFEEAFKEAAGAWSEEKHPELKTLSDVRAYVRNLRAGAPARLERLTKYRRAKILS